MQSCTTKVRRRSGQCFPCLKDFLLVKILTIIVMTIGPASGATDTWALSPSGGKNNFNRAPDWSSAVAPSSGDLLAFAGSSVTNLNNDFIGYSFSGFQFLANAAPFAISGNAVTLTGGITNNAATAEMINLAITNNPGSVLIVSNSSVSGNVTMAGVLVGTGAWAVAGAGTVIFSSSNSYTGGTTVVGGTLMAGTNYAFGSGSLSISSGAILSLGGFTASNSAVSLSNGSIIGSGTLSAASYTATGGRIASSIEGSSLTTSLVKNGLGTLSLTASNTYAGGTVINSGTVSFAIADALGAGTVFLSSNTVLSYAGTGGDNLALPVTVLAGNAVIQNASGGLLTLSGPIRNQGSLLELYGGSYNVSANISGNNGLFQSGLILSNASATLSGSNTFYGPALLVAGSSLLEGAANALPVTAILDVGGASDGLVTNIYNLNGYGQTLSGLTSLGGGLNLITNGSPTLSLLTLGGSGTNTFSGSILGNIALSVIGGVYNITGSGNQIGATVINGGTLNLGATGTLGATASITITNGGMLLLGGSNQIGTNTPLSLDGTLSMGGSGTSRAGSQGFSTLSLTGNSVIDFSSLAGVSSLTFSSIAFNGHPLSVYGWNGTTLWGTISTTGGDGQLTGLFDLSPLSSADLGRISFYSGEGSGFLGTGQLIDGKIIPVPEPATLTAALGLTGILFLGKLKQLCKASPA